MRMDCLNSRTLSLLMLLSCLAVPAFAQSNAELGAMFLRNNAGQEGVTVTDSGLQYKILEPGNELRAGKRSKVTVHYQGKDINGEVFDSNFGSEPVTLRLSRVIKGWTEGLQLIGEGGRIVLYIPSELAYGRRGSPPAIGKNETLVFIIDLIDIL